MKTAREMLDDSIVIGLYTVRENEVTIPSFAIIELMEKFAGQFKTGTFRDTQKHKLLQILDQVCDFFELPVADVISKSRKRDLADARAVYCRHAKENHPGYTWDKIGSVINKDHASVISAYKRAFALKEIDTKYRQCYARETHVAYTIMASAGGTGAQSISHTSKGSMVSYGKVEKRSQRVSEAQPAL
jgi:hypothetical protein